MRAATADRLGGRSIVFGDSVNTDVIIPGRYLVSIDPVELGTHAFEPLGPEVQAKLKASPVVVAGRNFGCGSAREQAATCLIGVGVKAVVARSYSRVFFRNAINTGLVAVERAGGGRRRPGGRRRVGRLRGGHGDGGRAAFPFAPFPPLLRILEAGGLIPYVAEQIMPKFAEEKR